jgi:signal transduction histidine kinase
MTRRNSIPKNNIVSDIGRSDTDARLHVVTHDLVERIKELNCLYGISRLVEKKGISINEILQGVVDLIPPAWQYPEVTCACIKLRNKKFITSNYRETQWKQIEPIIINNRFSGMLEVYYLEERPFCYEGPFLKEERDLVHGIAERLGHIIESKNSELALHKLYAREKKLHRKLQMEMKNRVDFTRQLIHELKTPLTALMATSQLLSEETHNSPLEKLSNYVLEGANILNNRIDELHDVIKGEIGKLNLDFKSLNIQNTLDSLVDEMQALIRQHHMSLKLEIENGPLPEVLADEQRIRQILFNLVNNACKYASEGGSVVVRASEDRIINSVLIEIKDYGPGISKEKQRNLFRPGYESSRDADQPGGLGIGLPLCSVLVRLHGGLIWLESTLGQGCSFFFTIPISKFRPYD